MRSPLGSLREFALTPPLDSVTFAVRGFAAPPPPTADRLEAIPQSVILGFEFGISSRTEQEIVERIRLVREDLQGFAYEGATMALTIRDVMGGGATGRTRGFLRGPAAPHIFLSFIGIGFAMARLPRRLWHKVVPDLAGTPYFPALSWLAVDGYGFDRAYFDTRRWVTGQHRPRPYAWQGAPDYFPRAVDQGIGRALWFIHGADPDLAAAAALRFPAARQSDLFSGIGLAATFAGGADREGLETLVKAAGDFYPDLAQGVVFAAKARSQSGLRTPHTELAVREICALSVDEAAALADEAAAAARSAADPREYETWRVNTRRHFSR